LGCNDLAARIRHSRGGLVRKASLKTTARQLAVACAARLAVICAWAGCSSNPYFIGAICPPGDGGVGSANSCAAAVVDEGGADPGVRFAIDLDQSGAS